MTWKKMAMFGIPALALTLGASGGAQADLVVNGGFESTTSGGGQLGFNTNATGWSVPTGSYTFLFTPGSADTTGVNGQYGGLSLWGPGNGSANGLPASSPNGGNFIAQDSGGFQPGALTQTISGLTAGDTYTVGFYWAAAQQSGFNGATDSGWTVNLGTNTATAQSTSPASIPSHGFSGWMYQTFNFTADSTSDMLSFMAFGGPEGVPPFALLDGVTMNAVPEPSSMLIFGAGLLGLGVVGLRRRAKPAAV